jgi:hypothetical protein
MQRQSPTIYWANFSAITKNELQNTFADFQRNLAQQYPQIASPPFASLPAKLVHELPGYLISQLPGTIQDDDEWTPYSDKLIFVMCSGQEEFVKVHQAQNDLAHWGIAVRCKFSIAWEPNQHLIWHELLHLFNAKDCYNKFGINKCPAKHCLMRRATHQPNYGYGTKLTLCSKNLRRIQRFVVERDSLSANPSDVYGSGNGTGR